LTCKHFERRERETSPGRNVKRGRLEKGHSSRNEQPEKGAARKWRRIFFDRITFWQSRIGGEKNLKKGGPVDRSEPEEEESD